jgi:hypothetical protein
MAKDEAKIIGVRPSEVPNVSDVLCIVEPRGGRDVIVLANAKGRECLQRIFPNSQPSWKPNASDMPPNWRHAIFHVPELARLEHALPSITGDTPLKEATPTALAYLLAYAVERQGGRDDL